MRILRVKFEDIMSLMEWYGRMPIPANTENIQVVYEKLDAVKMKKLVSQK